MAGKRSAPASVEKEVDSFEWCYGRYTPVLRTTLDQEDGLDELPFRRKPRISSNLLESIDSNGSNRNSNRYRISFEVIESGDDEGNRVREPGYKSKTEKAPNTIKNGKVEKLKNTDVTNEVKTELKEQTSYRPTLESNHNELLPVLDHIMNDYFMNEKEETTVMTAEYSATDHKSPFQKDKDGKSMYPSSRLRARLTMDELGKEERLEDRIRKDHSGQEDKASTVTLRGTLISDKTPLEDQRKAKTSNQRRIEEEDDFDTSKGGEGSKRGKKVGFNDGAKIKGYRDKQGGRPGDLDCPEGKYRDGARSKDMKASEDRTRPELRTNSEYRPRLKYGTVSVDGNTSEDGARSEGEERLADASAIPKTTTTQNTLRRYHLQVTDLEMKETWFNSCFNVSEENNVDFNYEGPVKITPYYIIDKIP